MVNYKDLNYWEKYNIEDYNMVKKYIDFISNIQDIGNRNLEYCEWHHIVPVSFDKELAHDKDNYIKLTGSEHFIAHKILAQCFRGNYNYRMSYAFVRMCKGPNSIHYNMTPDDYELSRILFSKANSENRTGRKYSEETRRKISESNRRRKGKYSDETRRKISESKKGHKMSDEARENMSKAHNPDNIPPNHKGQIYVNNGEYSKIINPEELDFYIANGWNEGKCKYKKKFMRKDNKEKLVEEYEFDKYIKDGWEFGRKKRNKGCKQDSVSL